MTSQAPRRALGSKPVVGSSRKKDRGVPDDADSEIQPPLLPPGQRLDLALLLAGEADDPDHLADITRTCSTVPAMAAGGPLHEFMLIVGNIMSNAVLVGRGAGPIRIDTASIRIAEG